MKSGRAFAARLPVSGANRPAPGRRFLRAAAAAAVLATAGCQGGDEDALSVVISLPEQHLATAAKATLVVDYSGTGARLLSEGGGPACAFILPGVDGEFSDDRQGTLTIQASGPRATRGPADIAACRMRAGDGNATAADLASKLTVRVQAAEDAAGKPVDLAAATARHGAGGGTGGGGSGTRMSEDDIEEAQAKAVKAAASIKKATTTDPAANPVGDAEKAGGATVGSGPGTNPGGAGSAPPAPAPAARPATPANISRPPAAAPAPSPPVADDGAEPGVDKDPGYEEQGQNPEAPAYSIDFFVETPGTFGALQLDVNHLGNRGGFIGPGDKVDCVPLVEAIVASNYVGEREVKIGLISLQGINTPAPIIRCGFRSSENVSPGSFLIEVTDASDIKSEPVDPKPNVIIKSIFPKR